jgi:hypothetical protein
MLGKRNADGIQEGADKKVRTSRFEHPAGSWNCVHCGNVNWPQRAVCNQASCNMPREFADGSDPRHPEGSWACITCNNINWPKRAECNKCGNPRGGMPRPPPPPPFDPLMGGPMGNPPPMPPPIMGPPHPPPPPPIGGPPMGYDGYGRYPSPGYGPPPPFGGGPPGYPPYGPPFYNNDLEQPPPPPQYYARGFTRPDGSFQHPEGSWTCPACNNINWPGRVTCNKKECGKAKPASKPAMLRGFGDGYVNYEVEPKWNKAPPQGHPAGSWPCPKCGNINWPMRTICNKQECRTARP